MTPFEKILYKDVTILVGEKHFDTLMEACVYCLKSDNTQIDIKLDPLSSVEKITLDIKISKEM